MGSFFGAAGVAAGAGSVLATDALLSPVVPALESVFLGEAYKSLYHPPPLS